jgi:predicted nucleotidyltransferase
MMNAPAKHNHMQQRIVEELHRIEAVHGIKVLYACESGSRAWGFPSADSDYDVRFLYLHPREHYLSIDIEHRRDVIERPISEMLDINGWDLRKALQLLRKSNPPLLEWLQSPIVYLDRFDVAAALRDLLATYHSPIGCAYHYLSMARNNHRSYLRGDMVKLKKYFYVLRPLLAVQWLEAGRGPVPTEFDHLVQVVVQEAALRGAIEALIEKKKSGLEGTAEARVPEFDAFIESELARLENVDFQLDAPRSDTEPLNILFREHLAKVWRVDAVYAAKLPELHGV